MISISTRSSIGIKYKDGTIKAIYCHYDGYIEYNGKMLYYHYRNIEKIQELIDLGQISFLNKKVKPNPKFLHGFDYEERQKDVVVAYARDRGEDNVSYNFYKNMEEYKQKIFESMKVYSYLYDEKKEKWFVSIIPYKDINNFDYKELKQEILEKGLVDLKEDIKTKLADNLIRISKDYNYYEFIDNYNNYDDAFYDIYNMLGSNKIYSIREHIYNDIENIKEVDFDEVSSELDYLIHLKENEYDR